MSKCKFLTGIYFDIEGTLKLISQKYKNTFYSNFRALTAAQLRQQPQI